MTMRVEGAHRSPIGGVANSERVPSAGSGTDSGAMGQSGRKPMFAGKQMPGECSIVPRLHSDPQQSVSQLAVLDGHASSIRA